MVQPTDYTIKTVDPTETFTKTLGMYQGLKQNQQAIEANKLTLEAARQKIEADKAGQERLLQTGQLLQKAISPGATVQDVQSAMIFAAGPEQYNGLKSIYEAMDDTKRSGLVNANLPIYAALVNGQPKVAIPLLEQRRDAYANSGDTANAAKHSAWIDAIKADPEAAGAIQVEIGALLAADSKFGAPGVEAVLKQAKAPAEIALGQSKARREGALADTATVEAENAETNAKLDIITKQKGITLTEVQTREIRQRTKLAKEEADRIAQSSPVKLTAGSQLTLNKMVEESVASMATAEKYLDYAGRLDNSGLAGGLFGSTTKFIADLGGNTSLLRSEGERLKGSAIINGLPMGSASDADINMAKAGYPKSNASAAIVASYFRGAAVVAGVEAQLKANRAEWLAMNGDLGSAKKPMVIGGRQVQPGETVMKYQAKSMRPVLDEVNRQLGIVAPKKDGKQDRAASGGVIRYDANGKRI